MRASLLRKSYIFILTCQSRCATTVKAAAPLAGTTNATIGQMISAATTQRVPLVDRDVYKLVQLSPGITPVNGAVNNVEFNERPGAEVSGFSINGLPQGTLYYLEDGAPLTIAENNLGAMIPAEIPPLDSIQEYQIETNNVPASTQSFGTGVLSLVSKSGANKVHGDGFFYGRPNFWAANDPFVKASQLEAHEPNKPPNFHRYQWGGSVGGPIRHDKVFYFADYELAAFNVTNSVQLGIPNAFWNPASLASFGQVTYAASQPRQFQFGLRFIY